MRILFVEDELELLELATAQLQRANYAVVPCRTVFEAQEILASEGPKIHCVIADHRLPDGYGVAFCVQCRVRRPDLIVGVVSGCLTQQDIELMQEFNVPFWKKPVLYHQVGRELEKEYLEKQKARMAADPVDADMERRPPPKGSTLSGFLRGIFKPGE